MFQILIVEDDVEQAELYKAALAGGGYSIRMCPDGVSALATIDAGTPDLALLDVQLPIPDGYELCRAIRARETPDHPCTIMMATTRLDTVSKLLGFAAGADDYLVKPIDLRELRSRVSRWLGTRSAQADVIRRRRHEAITEVVETVCAQISPPLASVCDTIDSLLQGGQLDARSAQALEGARHQLRSVVNAVAVFRKDE